MRGMKYKASWANHLPIFIEDSTNQGDEFVRRIVRNRYFLSKEVEIKLERI